jgi:hypothetical protein
MNILKAILKEIFVRPMPQHDPMSAIQWKRRKDTGKQKADNTDSNKDKRFNTKALCFETKTVINKDESEWILHGHEKTRIADLTPRDREVLKERGLQNLEDKARIIKKFWSEHQSRKMIVFELGKMKVRGCKEATIGKICAALSYANGEIGD